MENITAILITIVLALAGSAAPVDTPHPALAFAEVPISAPTIVASEPAMLTLIGATKVQTDMVTEAIVQFEDANLELPALQIEFYDDKEGCRGHEGLFFAGGGNSDGTIDRITICNRMKLILLHELAHAWSHHSIDDGARATFTEHWGLDHWNSSDDAWCRHGALRLGSGPTRGPNRPATCMDRRWLRRHVP